MIGKAMFLFILFVVLMTEWSEAGLPPTTLKGIGQASKTTTFNFEVNGNQATKTSTGTLIDNCGMPSNLLANCSGEHATAGSGWSTSVTSTATATYGSANTATKEFGNKQITWSCAGGASGGTCLFYQDVTTSKTIQGLTYLYASTTSAAATQYVSRINGATKNTIQFQTTNEFQYKSAEVLGSSSTGLGILVSVPASTTYTGTIDWAAIGAVDLKQDINVVGAWTTFTPTGSWTTNTTYTGKYRQVGENLEAEVTASLSGAPTGTLTINLPSGFSVDTAKITSTSFSNARGYGYVNDSGTQGYNLYVVYASSTSVQPYLLNAGSTYASTASVTATTPVTLGSGDSVTMKFSVPVTQFSGASSVYTAQNADTDWASCGHTTSDFTGFGTVTNIETQCKREGSDLLMRGRFTSGTATATEARLGLKLNGVSLTSKNTTGIASIQKVGEYVRNILSEPINILLVEPSVGYITFSATGNGSLLPLSKGNGSTLFGSGQVASFNARIPINGWENSNTIIGTFNEVMTTPGVTKPKKCTFSAGGTGSLTSPTTCSSSPCIEYEDTCQAGAAPTRSASGAYAVVISNGTWANSARIKCSGEAYASGALRRWYPLDNGNIKLAANSSGGGTLDFRTTDSAGTNTDTYYQFDCEGQAP